MFKKVINEKLDIKSTDTIHEILDKLLPYRSNLSYAIKQVDKYIDECIKSNNSHIMQFGKYKGKTLQWIIDNDIDYIYWLIDNNVMNLNCKYMGIPSKSKS